MYYGICHAPPYNCVHKKMESVLLRRFYGDILATLSHPRKIASMLYSKGIVSKDVLDEVCVSCKLGSEGVVSEDALDEVRVSSKPCSEGIVSEDAFDEVLVSSKPCSAIMDAVDAAVIAEPRNLLVVIAILEKFTPESAIVADRMRDELRYRHQLAGERSTG